MDNIDKIRGLNSKIIVGIETGNILEHPAAIAVEVKGHGDSTVFKLLYYAKRSFPEDLQKMLEGVAEGNDFDGEEAAGINFLVLHHLASLYGELLEELGGNLFPNDPTVLSGMIDRIVASHFTIDIDGRRELLPVGELILKELVTEMIDKFELGDEAREAIGIALLANESLYYEKIGIFQKDGIGPEELSPGVNISRGVEGGGNRKTVLNGRFFFPY